MDKQEQGKHDLRGGECVLEPAFCFKDLPKCRMLVWIDTLPNMIGMPVMSLHSSIGRRWWRLELLG